MDAEQQAANGIVDGYFLENPSSSTAISIAPPKDRGKTMAYGEYPVAITASSGDSVPSKL